MQSTGVFLALAVLVVAAFASSSSQSVVDDIPTNYLPLPKEDNKYRNQLWDEVLSQDTRPAGLSPEQLLADSEELSKSSPSTYVRHFAGEMHKLGEKRDEACNGNVHEYIYQILSLAKQRPDSPALINHVNFLKTIGKAKYAECAAGVPLDFELRIDGSIGMYNRHDFDRFEKALDWFYTAYATKKKLHKRLSCEQLYEVAKGADLARDDLNIGQMLEVAEFHLGKRYIDTKPKKGEMFRVFLESACRALREPLNFGFGNYNIAAALGSQLPNDIPVRFLKLNEYNRVCLAFDDTAEANLERQAEAYVKGGKWY